LCHCSRRFSRCWGGKPWNHRDPRRILSCSSGGRLRKSWYRLRIRSRSWGGSSCHRLNRSSASFLCSGLMRCHRSAPRRRRSCRSAGSWSHRSLKGRRTCCSCGVSRSHGPARPSRQGIVEKRIIPKAKIKKYLFIFRFPWLYARALSPLKIIILFRSASDGLLCFPASGKNPGSGRNQSAPGR